MDVEPSKYNSWCTWAPGGMISQIQPPQICGTSNITHYKKLRQSCIRSYHKAESEKPTKVKVFPETESEDYVIGYIVTFSNCSMKLFHIHCHIYYPITPAAMWY